MKNFLKKLFKKKKFLMEQLELISSEMEAYDPLSDEYNTLLKRYCDIEKELNGNKKFSFEKLLPWATLGVTTISSVVVPITLANLAYKKEEDGELSNGKVWAMSQKHVK